MINFGKIVNKRDDLKLSFEKNSSVDFEESLRSQGGASEKYVLRLFITGMSPRSINAINNVKKICEENLQGRYELEVIDIYQSPDQIKKEDIIASPTLIRKLPLPLRKLIGDMSDKERIIVGLDLRLKK